MPLPRQGPAAAPSAARVPHAISITSRICGAGRAPFFCPPAPGRPNEAAFASVSATVMPVPSQATASSPATCDHGSRPGDSGAHSRRNTDSSGLSPSRRRAAVSAVVAGAASPSPAVTCKNTDWYGNAENRHNPSVKYTATRAGSSRTRISHARPSPTASSTSPGGITYVSTPSQAPGKIFPRADGQPHDMAP